MYGISSFCTLSENNSFLHGKISCFCIFLTENGVFNTNRSPRVADGIRNEPHQGISKDSDLCASAHRCPHYAYARLITRVNSQVIIKPRCIHTGAACLLFQFPDVSVVLCDGSVGGEEACLGDVHQHHLLPLLLILVISECLILYLDVVL